jgi:hypothetical protein
MILITERCEKMVKIDAIRGEYFFVYLQLQNNKNNDRR